jgi:hypothetical protein
MKVRIKEQPAASTRAVVSVGGGRGFVVEIDHEHFVPHGGAGRRVIITAAHCLPAFPPCHPWSYTEEQTYKNLLAPLGAKPTVYAECLFADPIADIAVLGTPDNQVFSDQANAYEALVASVTPLLIADAPKRGRRREPLPYGGQSIEFFTPGQGPALLLSLSGKWVKCTVKRTGAAWLSIEPGELVDSGMSGSPIVSMDGRVIGLVSTGSLNPVLVETLPPRLLCGIKDTQ